MIFLQGGPSHLDLWDPKPNVPDNVKSVFNPIDTKTPGLQVTELMPKLAQVTDKLTLIRSVSYTPNGLFNHTAAIYQMMTGYTTDGSVRRASWSRPARRISPTSVRTSFGSSRRRCRCCRS